MADRGDDAPERRKHPRIAPKGTVVVRAGEHTQQGRVVNLGLGGVLVATNVAAPSRLLGRQASVELRLDGRYAEWLRGSGKICRIGPDSFAITFEDISPILEREINDMASSSHAHYRVMNIVLVDADPQRRAAMLAAFRAVGCTVIEASSPLEAIVRLGESSFEPDLIAIGDSMPSTIAEELRTFVDREHPNTKLVTIGNEIIEPIGSAHWLSSANPAADLLKRVREMLGRPRRSTTNS